MEDMNNELTIDYVADFLKGRGYDISERSETSILFYAFEQYWTINIDPKGCFNIALGWILPSTVDLQIFAKSMNATNLNCWHVKCSMDFEDLVDLEGNPIKTADVENLRRQVNFSCEQICNKKADFEAYFDIFILCIIDATDYQAKAYYEMLEIAKKEN